MNIFSREDQLDLERKAEDAKRLKGDVFLFLDRLAARGEVRSTLAARKAVVARFGLPTAIAQALLTSWLGSAPEGGANGISDLD